jgi:hypothetical protein
LFDPDPTEAEQKAIARIAETIREQIDAEILAILAKPLIHDVILVGLTDDQGIKEMKAEGFVPLGWTDEEIHYGTTKEDRQAGGSEDQAEG